MSIQDLFLKVDTMEVKKSTLAFLKAPSFSVDLDEVTLRNGVDRKRIRIDHPPAVAIVPLIDNKTVLLVQQFRYSIGRETLEFPAGKMDPGENPEQTVHRELLEETGYEANQIHPLISYLPAIGYANEIIKVYLARDLKQVDGILDDAEISSLKTLTLDQIKDRIIRGEIQDGKTILAFLAWQSGISFNTTNF